MALQHDGMESPIEVRPVERADAAELVAFYARLSPESRRRRFLCSTRGLDERLARRFTSVDHVRSTGLVATLDGHIVGHACVEESGAGAVEMAFAVDDAWQRRGIGRRLLAEAVAWARRHGVSHIDLSLFADNLAMHRMLRSIPGSRVLVHPDGSVDQVELTLPAAA